MAPSVFAWWHLALAEYQGAHFNILADYIGPYFKRNAVTLRGYRYSLNEIASEFGLTDESHVKKIL